MGKAGGSPAKFGFRGAQGRPNPLPQGPDFPECSTPHQKFSPATARTLCLLFWRSYSERHKALLPDGSGCLLKIGPSLGDRGPHKTGLHSTLKKSPDHSELPGVSKMVLDSGTWAPQAKLLNAQSHKEFHAHLAKA